MQLLDVQNLVQSQSQKHRERLLSQFSRFTDSSPSFPLYYSIDGVNSTAEIGTRDIMTYVGPDSPVKFKKITNVPLWSLNAITASITFDEVSGVYTDYEDQGLCLNSVLRPLPGDHFIIPEFNPEVIFVVTNVNLRQIRGEDHYVFDYSVIPTSRGLNIEAQVVEMYSTIFRNIGTEDKVLIKQDDYNLLNEYLDIYSNISQRFIDENYSKAYGYITTPEWLTNNIGFGTCKYLINFLMKYRIIYFDEILKLVFAFEQVLPFEPRHNIIYTRHFILNSFINKRVPAERVYVNFKPLPIALFTQIQNDKLGQSIEFNHVPLANVDTYAATDSEVMVYDTTFTSKIINKEYTSLRPIELVIAKFVNDVDITKDEFTACIDDYESSDIFRFYFLPMVLFILKIRIKALQTAAK